MAGIFGNDEVEAMYPLLSRDSDGNKPDCSKSSYTLTFPRSQLPPVNAFWSVTIDDGKTQLLIENPINRYLINSPMLPYMKTNDDGSVTLYIQKDSPGKDKESNWLQAPRRPDLFGDAALLAEGRGAEGRVEAASRGAGGELAALLSGRADQGVGADERLFRERLSVHQPPPQAGVPARNAPSKKF